MKICDKLTLSLRRSNMFIFLCHNCSAASCLGIVNPLWVLSKILKGIRNRKYIDVEKLKAKLVAPTTNKGEDVISRTEDNVVK